LFSAVNIEIKLNAFEALAKIGGQHREPVAKGGSIKAIAAH
jgi:hypothetical protein